MRVIHLFKKCIIFISAVHITVTYITVILILGYKDSGGLEVEVPGGRSRGRPSKTWWQTVSVDM